MDKLYLRRCFDLARLGNGKTAPNPLVGSVLVHSNRIVGEGFHETYGKAHAEVNACANVKDEDRVLFSKSTLYVSLEPCCVQGKTPPCTDLILERKIPRVVVATRDNTLGVRGRSIELLGDNGVEVIEGVLKEQGKALFRTRNTIVMLKRPFIILKYAQSQDGYLGQAGKQIWLSNAISKRWVHKWRSEVGAIIVGTNTALVDNPRLTNRLYYGKSPLRIVLDRNLRLPSTAALLDDSEATWVITEQEKTNPTATRTTYHQLSFDETLIPNILEKLYQQGIDSLIVEGGAQLLQSFIEADLWDEARVFVAPKDLNTGIKAPEWSQTPESVYQVGTDRLQIFRNIRHSV